MYRPTNNIIKTVRERRFRSCHSDAKKIDIWHIAAFEAFLPSFKSSKLRDHQQHTGCFPKLHRD